MRPEGVRQERQERDRPAGEMRGEAPRNDSRADTPIRGDGQQSNDSRPDNREPREPRAEGARSERPRRERGERAERGERIPRDAAEQDLALANQAAMAAAGRGGEGTEPVQDRPAQDAGRNNEGRRERGDRNGRRNDRRGERGEGDNAGIPSEGAFNPEAAPSMAAPAIVATPSPMLDAEGNSPAVAPTSEQGQEPRQPRERRSRDRYGRDRRERSEGPERSDSDTATEPAFTANAAVPASSEPKQVPAQQELALAATEVVAPISVAPVVQEALSVSPAAPAEPARVAEPVVVALKPVVTSTAAAAEPGSGGLPKVQSYDLPLQDLTQVAQASGLQWVNSDAGKIAEVNAAMALEIKPVHVPRERVVAAVSTEAPLVLVETKRDLREMPLPFEKPAQ